MGFVGLEILNWRSLSAEAREFELLHGQPKFSIVSRTFLAMVFVVLENVYELEYDENDC
ncbi:hypothetical protein HAX54_026331 [Datura stramonium]|uniref:Uncharacterized protein n=1 Tax=Datura stramonium TaxID=4076 RepID=A0ABS8RK87_DATST|nr:hypothetical protein [Datura stramonium]